MKRVYLRALQSNFFFDSYTNFTPKIIKRGQICMYMLCMGKGIFISRSFDDSKKMVGKLIKFISYL